ncbi:MAG: TonB-dependent receptor plug domain-containing protein [Sphingomicrobium sp.]
MKASIVRYGSALRTGSALTALAVAGLTAVPAYAADTAPQPTPPATTAPQNTTSQSPTSPDLQPPAPGKGANASQTTTSQKGEQAIVITGTVSRQTQTASPVTVVSSSNLQDRGITTISEAVQQLVANNAGADPASWTAWGFATGASAPSLRGFNDAYTVTLFDGLRSAYYPLADDGYRNFVDINTIPESIVDRVEVLQDGASANYGADAVAGVVNVIIKREIQGIHVNGSYGISSRNDAGEKRIDATLGYGSLADQGFNVYVNGEYQKNDPLFMRDRGYPFNTSDLSRECITSAFTGDKNCGFNGVVNGIQWNGDYLGFGTTYVGYGIPYTVDATGKPTGPAGATNFQLLNPAAGCQGLPSVTLTAAQQTATTPANGVVCQEDLQKNYFMYAPSITRKGLNFHGTVNITPDIQAYAMANWYEVSTYSQISPISLSSMQTAAGGPLATVSRIYLPVYVCPQAQPVFTATNQV